jgi:cardiolipin synthase
MDRRGLLAPATVATVPKVQARQRHSTVPPAWAARADDLRYALPPQAMQTGHRVRFLVDGGETFPAMLEAIRGAEHSVYLETYILQADHTGRKIGEALAARARAGLKVRLLYDAVGGLGLPDGYLSELTAAGVEVHDFHPIAPWRLRFAWNQRDHRKILVVDDRIGFTGGLNIGDDYASVAEGGVGWRDSHCRIEGPAVHELVRLFRRGWCQAGGTDFELPPASHVHFGPPHGAFCRVIGNEGRRGRTPIRRAYLHAIKHAERTILVANAYFIPDRGIRRALANAVRRGCQVQVIVPGEANDLPSVRWASHHLYGRLLRAGVKIYEWAGHGMMMHAKTACIDGLWCAIGSSNLDKRSFNINLEVVATFIDRELGSRMVAQFARDLARTEAIELAAWKARPWWHRVIEWFWHLFSFWL